MRRSDFIFVLLLLAAGLPARAAALPARAAALPARAAASNVADAPHVRVQLVLPDKSLHPGAPNNAGLYFKLEPGWHVYWKNAGDSGEPPRIEWTLPKGIGATPLEFPPPRRLPLGPLMDFGYENAVLFPLHLDVADTVKPGPVDLKAKANWLVCREVCIPGKAELEEHTTVTPGGSPSAENAADAQLWQRFANDLPVSLPAGDKAVFAASPGRFQLSVRTGRRETQAAFFPADQDVIDNPSPQTVTPTSDGLVLALKKDANLTASPARLNGLLELAGGRNYVIAATPGAVSGAAPAAKSAGLARIAGLAFLGGLLLNLMPCVFPVLFLKGLALVQSGAEERRRLRAHGLVYTVGILVSFWALVAALLGLRAAGATVGWGFQFQSPVFLVLMACLLFFLGLSLAGQFEIGLTLTSAGGSLAARQGYAGSFFTGVLAVVVATPCSAPFMGAAVGYALSQPVSVTFAVFTALALGLAAPYLALTLQPAWTRLLPRPGAWMEILRQAISVPIFMTVIWLAWVLATGYGSAVLAALLSSFLLVAIAGWFLGRWPARGWSRSIAALILAGVAVLAVFEQKLAAAPAAAAATPAAGSAEAWQPWSPQAVSRELAQGRPVFVDFTASWCLSCQVNERVALSQPEVRQAFVRANVALLRADWTREDPRITEALTALGRSGVPVYALYTPGESNPTLLPQVLTPGIVAGAVQNLTHGETQAAAIASNRQ